MKHLSIPKRGFGILLTLVLAFSVQGNPADALTFGNHSSSDGDLRTVYKNQEFKIKVPVTLKTAERKSGFKPVPSTDESDTPVTVPEAERTNMFYDDDPDIKYIHGTTPRVNYAAAHYYDQENITITVTGNADIKKVGSSYNVPSSRADNLTMYESTHDSYEGAANDQRFSGSVTLTLAPTGVGTVKVKVSDSTAAADNRDGESSGLLMIYTVYIVNYKSSAASALDFATTTIASNTNYAVGRDDTHDSPVLITVTPAENTPITFEVVKGPGKFYVEKDYSGDDDSAPNSKSSSKSKLETSSNAASGSDAGANVYLDMGGGTNRVTISAPGTIAPVTAIFIYGYPRIEISDGDGQIGAPGGRLEDPLVVKVKDGKNSGIPTALVTFGSTAGGERFFPVPGTTVHVDTTGNWASSFTDIEDRNKPKTATAFEPMTDSQNTADDVIVQTDSSGEAEVYFQLGTPVGNQFVTVDSVGATQQTFSVRAATAGNTRTANLEILSGNPQTGEKGQNLTDPLVVIARSTAGHRISNVIIQFRTVTGTLTPAYGTEQPAISDSATRTRGQLPQGSPSVTIGGETVTPPSGQQIYVKTSANGEARVNYNIGQTVVAREVIAEVRFEESDAQFDFAIDRVIFNINEEPDPEPEPEPAPAHNPRLKR